MGPMAVARMPPISLASASCVNRVREPKSSAIVTLSSENRPRTPMFRPITMASVMVAAPPLLIISVMGTANATVSRVSAM